MATIQNSLPNPHCSRSSQFRKQRNPNESCMSDPLSHHYFLNPACVRTRQNFSNVCEFVCVADDFGVAESEQSQSSLPFRPNDMRSGEPQEPLQSFMPVQSQPISPISEVISLKS